MGLVGIAVASALAAFVTNKVINLKEDKKNKERIEALEKELAELKTSNQKGNQSNQ